MKSLISIVILCLLSIALAGTPYSANARGKKMESRHEMNKEMQAVSRASKIIGTDLKNRKDENLGDVKDLVLDPENGRVAYVVVSYGGIMGMGDKLFAIPWAALHWNRDKDYFILDMDKETLKNAPGFDQDHWPDSTNKWEQQRMELNQFYRTKR